MLTQIDQDKDLVLKKWFVASIYHDVGYPSEKLEILVKDFFRTEVGCEIKSQFDWSLVLIANNNIKHIRELSELFGRGDSSKTEKFEKWLYKRLVDNHDHGVLTALMLLNKNWTNGDIPLAKEAALAIAIHNWRRAGNNVEIDIGPLQMEEFPLAFFLSYCDTAQEWGRKVLLELLREEGTQAIMPEIPMLDTKLENVEVNQDITTVKIKYESKFEDNISGTRTLRDVFEDVGRKFETTWSRNGQSLNPMIVGIDRNNITRSGFGISVNP